MSLFVVVLCVLCAFVVKNPSPVPAPQLSAPAPKVMYMHIFDVMICHVFAGLTSHFLSCSPVETRSMWFGRCRSGVGPQCGPTPETVQMWGNVGEFHSHPFTILSCRNQSKGQRQPHGYRCP